MRLVEGSRRPGIGYVRLLSLVGVHWKDERRHRLYYSERTGRRPPHLRLGTYRIRFLGARR